jgi:hypothetical protein
MREEPDVKAVTYENETHDLGDWAKIRGIKVVTLHYRHDAGWPPDQMLGFKPRRREKVRTVTYEGETLTINEWSRRLQTHASSMHVRYLAGYSPAQILGLEPIPVNNYFIRNAKVYTRSDGMCGTLDEWAERLGKSRKTLEARIRRCWSIDRALELGTEKPVSSPGQQTLEENRCA